MTQHAFIVSEYSAPLRIDGTGLKCIYDAPDRKILALPGHTVALPRTLTIERQRPSSSKATWYWLFTVSIWRTNTLGEPESQPDIASMKLRPHVSASAMDVFAMGDVLLQVLQNINLPTETPASYAYGDLDAEMALGYDIGLASGDLTPYTTVV